jgi:hypothetical protein
LIKTQEKSLEYDKVYAAFYFWYQYRIIKNSDTESASKTLKEIAELDIDDGIQTFPFIHPEILRQ